MSKFTNGQKPHGQVGRWKRWKEPDARRALAELRRSGLSAAEFCAREGYSVTRLRYWTERLDVQGDERLPTVSFVPLTLGDTTDARHIEIERGGVVLRVREDLDVEHVARLVAALGAGRQIC